MLEGFPLNHLRKRKIRYQALVENERSENVRWVGSLAFWHNMVQSSEIDSYLDFSEIDSCLDSWVMRSTTDRTLLLSLAFRRLRF